MANFGTYEGHRILSNAMSNTIDRAQKKYDGDRKFALEEKQFAENQKRNDMVMKTAQMSYDTQMKNQERDDFKRKTENDFLAGLQPDGGYNWDNITANNGQMLTDAFGRTKVSNVADLDPDGHYSLAERKALAGNARRTNSQEIFDTIVGHGKAQGWTSEELEQEMINAGLGDKMNQFYLQGLGINAGDLSESDIYNLTEKQSPGAGGLQAPGIKTFQAQGQTTENLSTFQQAEKAMDEFNKWQDVNVGGWQDSADEISISQDKNGKITLKEDDKIGDDEFFKIKIK